jgi:hypothetical protein
LPARLVAFTMIGTGILASHSHLGMRVFLAHAHLSIIPITVILSV